MISNSYMDTPEKLVEITQDSNGWFVRVRVDRGVAGTSTAAQAAAGLADAFLLARELLDVCTREQP